MKETLCGPYTCKQFAQTECLRKLLDSVGCCLRACASCLREFKTVWYFLRKQPMLAPSECLLAQTNLSITRSWHRVVVPAVVICSTIDHVMSSNGTAEERQFLISFIEEYTLLPALWCVTSTKYSNKINEQNAKLLNKYKKEKYLNVEKKCVIKK